MISYTQPRHVAPGNHGGRLLAAGALLVAGTVLATPAPSSAFDAGSFAGSLLHGSANGGSAQLAGPQGAVVKLGIVAPQSLGCNPALGSTVSKQDDEVDTTLNFVSSITLPIPRVGTALKAQQLRNSGYPTATDAEANVYEKATSSNVNVLDGVVTATTLQETAHTRLNAGGTFSEAATTFQDLFIDPDGSGPQQPVSFLTPGPNTVIDLGALGTLTLNEQIPLSNGIQANAVHLHVGSYGGYSGDIYVGHVETSITLKPARLSAFAYASKGTVAPLLASGYQALLNISCGGTNGNDKVLTGAGVHIPGPAQMPLLLDESSLRSTVNGHVLKSLPYVRASEHIEALRLLVDPNGVARVSADAIDTAASTTGSAADGVASTGSASLVNLVVDGTPIVLASPQETRTVDLAGIGTLVINQQRCRDIRAMGPPATASCLSRGANGDTHFNQITVNALHLTVTVADNPTGLPVGADLVIGVAYTSLAF
jgi:hypothetical protein